MLVADYRYSIHGLYTGGTPCRVRLFQTSPHPIMLVTALKANIGITNMIEYLAAQIAIEHRGLFPDGQPFCCIEHYPPGSGRDRDAYHSVVFASYQVRPGWREGEARMRLGSPRWIPVAREEIETMIGEALTETMPAPAS